MPLHDIRHLIGASSELDAVRKKAQRQAILQQAYMDYFGYAPVEFASLSKASRVGYIKAGTLYLLADQAAVAAKLRQLLPRLLPLFSKLEAEVTVIKVELQVNFPQQKPVARVKKNMLTIDSIEQFSKLSKAVRDPSLKLALTNLVNNRTKSGD